MSGFIYSSHVDCPLTHLLFGSRRLTLQFYVNPLCECVLCQHCNCSTTNYAVICGAPTSGHGSARLLMASKKPKPHIKNHPGFHRSWRDNFLETGPAMAGPAGLGATRKIFQLIMAAIVAAFSFLHRCTCSFAEPGSTRGRPVNICSPSRVLPRYRPSTTSHSHHQFLELLPVHVAALSIRLGRWWSIHRAGGAHGFWEERVG